MRERQEGQRGEEGAGVGEEEKKGIREGEEGGGGKKEEKGEVKKKKKKGEKRKRRQKEIGRGGGEGGCREGNRKTGLKQQGPKRVVWLGCRL